MLSLSEVDVSKGRTASLASAFSVGRCRATCPKGGAVEHGQDALASDRLFLGGGYKVGKALLHDRWRPGRVVILSQMNAPQGMAADELINASEGNRMKSLNHIRADKSEDFATLFL
jgi:hypothetical protein